MTPLDRLEWIAAVAANRDLWGAPAAVAGALAYLADKGHAHPGLHLLVQQTGLHKSTIARALNRLTACGYLGKIKRQGRGKASEYMLKLSRLDATVSADPVNGQSVAQTVAQTVAQLCDTDRGIGVVKATDITLSLAETSEGRARDAGKTRERDKFLVGRKTH